MFEEKRTLILHAGWPKTGTTTLQKHVFPKLEGFVYLGKIPWNGPANRFTFDLVYLLYYASKEKFNDELKRVPKMFRAREIELYGKVQRLLPIIISEEDILSALLKPSDHQYHGISVGSLSMALKRLKKIEKVLELNIDFLIVTRSPFEILHSYYAQMYKVFQKFRPLNKFEKYIDSGVNHRFNIDSGFTYLKKGRIEKEYNRIFPKKKLYSINMNELFTNTGVNMKLFYPGFTFFNLSTPIKENQRSGDADNIKIAHLRPLWVQPKRFHLKMLLNQIKNIIKINYYKHNQLEVKIELTDSLKAQLNKFFK